VVSKGKGPHMLCFPGKALRGKDMSTRGATTRQSTYRAAEVVDNARAAHNDNGAGDSIDDGLVLRGPARDAVPERRIGRDRNRRRARRDCRL